METLPSKNNRQEITSIPSDKVIRISEKLLEVNLLIGFKMDGEEILAWAKELDKLMTYEELEKLPFILDCFKRNELPFDNNQGIRNIFNALPMVTKTETGFKVLRAIW